MALTVLRVPSSFDSGFDNSFEAPGSGDLRVMKKKRRTVLDAMTLFPRKRLSSASAPSHTPPARRKKEIDKERKKERKKGCVRFSETAADPGPLSSEYGTWKTGTARFWLWLAGKGPYKTFKLFCLRSATARHPLGTSSLGTGFHYYTFLSLSSRRYPLFGYCSEYHSIDSNPKNKLRTHCILV